MERISRGLPELFYDLIGIFIPGFYLYFSLSLIYSQETLTIIQRFSFVNEYISTILLVYIAGHLVYTFSTIFIAKVFNILGGNPTYLLLGEPYLKRQETFNRVFLREVIDSNNPYYIETIQNAIRQQTGNKYFMIKDFPNRDIAYEYCRNFVMEKTTNRSANIRKEQAYGEMARGIIFVNLLSLLLLFIKELWIEQTSGFLFIVCFFTASLVAFGFRYGQARHISPVFIYSTFCSIINRSSDLEINGNK